MSSQLVAAHVRPAADRRQSHLYAVPARRFDRLTRLAAELLEVPVAMLTLVQADRQVLVSSSGLDEPRRRALDAALESASLQDFVPCRRPLVVSDAFQRPTPFPCRAAKNLGVVSCAGMPLLTPDGSSVGSLCVADFVPRDWTDDQLANLNMLAAVCIEEMSTADFDPQRP